MPDIHLKMINKLEHQILEFIDYDLVVKGSEYAKYYFILRTLAAELEENNSPYPQYHGLKKQPEWNEFPLKGPISAEKMIELQRNSAKAEIFLKERHEKEYREAASGVPEPRGTYPFDRTL